MAKRRKPKSAQIEHRQNPKQKLDPVPVAGSEDGSAYWFEMFTGPLPHPEMYKAYIEVDPQAADFIKDLAEREQKHRHEQEKRLAEADIAGYSRGQTWAGLIALALIGTTTLLFYTGHTWQGAGLGGAGFGTIVLAFLRNRFIEKPPVRKRESEDAS